MFREGEEPSAWHLLLAGSLRTTHSRSRGSHAVRVPMYPACILMRDEACCGVA